MDAAGEVGDCGDLGVTGQIAGRNLQRRKLDRGVEAESGRVVLGEAPHRHEVDLADPRPAALLPPSGRGPPRLGERLGAVDRQERSPGHADVARVAKQRDHVPDKVAVGRGLVRLRHQDLGVVAVPRPRPVLVGPADAKGKAWPPRAEHLLERLLQEPAASEPIIIEAKPVDPVGGSHRGLPLERGGVGQVVVADVRVRHVWLLVAGVHRPAAADVGPLGEALSPPGVVFRDPVKLGQVHGDQPHAGILRGHWGRG